MSDEDELQRLLDGLRRRAALDVDNLMQKHHTFTPFKSQQQTSQHADDVLDRAQHAAKDLQSAAFHLALCQPRGDTFDRIALSDAPRSIERGAAQAALRLRQSQKSAVQHYAARAKFNEKRVRKNGCGLHHRSDLSDRKLRRKVAPARSFAGNSQEKAVELAIDDRCVIDPAARPDADRVMALLDLRHELAAHRWRMQVDNVQLGMHDVLQKNSLRVPSLARPLDAAEEAIGERLHSADPPANLYN